MEATVYECDIAIIGGGFGGVAAALTAAEAGCTVVISEPTDWIGGQVTSQAVSPLDEHAVIETFGGTRAYYRYRDGVRAAYLAGYPAAQVAPRPLNPGNGWVSRLCYEPRVGLEVLRGMLAPHVETGRVRVLLSHRPAAVDVRGGHIREVRLVGPQGETAALHAACYLDASELGDLLPLAGIPYAVGAESAADTGEPHAVADRAHPERVQSFTCAMLVEYCPGEQHTIRKPAGYDYLREAQPFTLMTQSPGEEPRRHKMFEGEQPFWSYRRLFDPAQLTPGAFAHPYNRQHEIALINWDANDYYKESLIDRSPAQQARILREAQRLSLSFLYWLQTAAPRDDDRGVGYPGLRLLPAASGTPDGLAKAPYIRESRRILALRRVLEQDITPAPERGARALHYADSAGIGWYPIDLHRCADESADALAKREPFPPSLPFQIPLGALITPAVDNLIAAGKNIGATHITNAAYRVQPVEWAVGEAAGALAAACVTDNLPPRALWESPERLFAFQRAQLARGVPLMWAADVTLKDPDFIPIQTCLLRAASRPPQGLAAGDMPANSPRFKRLGVLPDALLSRSEAVWLLERLPRAQSNGALNTLLDRWRDAPLGPLSSKDWAMACWALDLPHPEGEHPSLREVCRKLADCV